jgi:hypothetical protein
MDNRKLFDEIGETKFDKILIDETFYVETIIDELNLRKMENIINLNQISLRTFVVTTTTRHDQNPFKSKNLSHLENFYFHLTPVISRLLLVNTMLAAC